MSAILIISPEPWSGHAVSKHHYARVLAARGRTVIFVEPPRNDLDDLRICPASGASNIAVVSGPRVALGLRYMPGALRRRLEGRWLSLLEAKAGVHIGTVWSFENSRFFDMRFAGDRVKIYHQVDLTQDFHPDTAAATADVCLGTNDFICARLSSIRPDVHKVTHGTVVVQEGDANLDPARFAASKVNVTCVGNLSIPYLDVDLLRRLVVDYPNVMFHMVGRYDETMPLNKVLRAYENVWWWGYQRFEVVAAILDRSDIHLVCYKATEYRAQLASSHKFMEYLLSGKVVVCSYTDEYKDKRHLVAMADLDQNLTDVFGRVVSNLQEYNSTKRQAERRAFALAHSYTNQLARIERIVWDSIGLRL